MKLEITKERILEAAAKCSTAKQTLQVLFPEAFAIPQIASIKAGDVFKHPTGICNTFLVVETRYAGLLQGGKYFQLLGLGCKPNSSSFFEDYSSHTMQECCDYLVKNNMVYSHNINDKIFQLFDKDFASKL